MRGWPDGVARDPAPSWSDVETLIWQGLFDQTQVALRQLTALLPALEDAADSEALLLALHGRAQLLRHAAAPVGETTATCDQLEAAAQDRGRGIWVAAACAMRSNTQLDAGLISPAMTDLMRVDLAEVSEELDSTAGFLLLEGLAMAYSRLRLHDRVDDLRARLDELVRDRSSLEQALHWARWCAELTARALEPLASGQSEPDHVLLARAVEVARRLGTVPVDQLPNRLRRGVDGVRALAAAYRGRPSEALRLLGQDAFGEPRDLPPLERQISVLAAMHAHGLVGSIAPARILDDAAGSAPESLPHLILDVCRARERLWLEGHAGGDVVAILHRLTDLLSRLSWQAMDLVAETAQQALEHRTLRAESRTDALTGVGNRRALDEELRHMLRFGPLPLSLVLVDIDDFKVINDQFSHVIGDEVLRRVATALSEQLRAGDRLVRYGGDEFVALLPSSGDAEAQTVANRMAEAVAQLPWSELAEELDVEITTGSATLSTLTLRRPDVDAGRLFQLADETLLEAKRRRSPSGEPPRYPATSGLPLLSMPPQQHTPANGSTVTASAMVRDVWGSDPLGVGPLPVPPPTGGIMTEHWTLPEADPEAEVASKPAQPSRPIDMVNVEEAHRPRRRPAVIDLEAGDSDRRSPFG